MNDSPKNLNGAGTERGKDPLKVLPLVGLLILFILMVASVAPPCGSRSPPSGVFIAAEAYQDVTNSMIDPPEVSGPIAYRIVVSVTNAGWRPIVFDTIQVFFNSENNGRPRLLNRHPHGEIMDDTMDDTTRNFKTASIAPGVGERFVFTGAETTRLNPGGWKGDVEFFFTLSRGRSRGVGTYAFQRPDSKDLPLYESSLRDGTSGKPLSMRFVTNH